MTLEAMKGVSVWLCTLIVCLSVAGVAQENASSHKRDVLVLVLDQLRADQLHCYGNPRQDSPNIDELAARGVHFTHYYTVASWTAPSFASLHTSLFPSKHGVTLFWRPGMPLLNKDVPTMAEDFRAHGYYTAAFVNNSLAGQDLTGLGFDEYHPGYAEALNITQRLGHGEFDPLSVTVRTANEVDDWLDLHRSQRFFLYVHFMAPHSPYDPPPQDDIFKSDAYPYLTQTGYDVVNGALLRLAMLSDHKAIERLYQLYDGKIHFVDRYVGQILNHLQTLGLHDNTLVFLTSDHGELLYSHPKDFLTFDHRSLYDTDLHIPFIAAGPGIPEGKAIPGLGSNVDSAPTILSLAELPPLSDAEGHSLKPMIDGDTESLNQYVYAEEDVAIPMRSVRDLHYNLVLNLWMGKEQLFDEEQDPKELTNAAAKHPDIVKELDSKLRAWMKENQPSRAVQLKRWRIYTAPEQVTIVDDQTIGGRMLLTGGGWQSDTSSASGNFAGGCFWTEQGDGSRTAVWRNDDPMIGMYEVSIYYGHPVIGRLATNAPFTIMTASGQQTVRVNFNNGAGQWHLLGTVENPRYVTETNAANGAIIVDAVRFTRLTP
ncbi:MAG TPA: sulfatase-like hydrolase/transferase [Terriglobia bacterium]|nr:sulfatase-like hydrolase/transferase [Terriglobia bacterium]